MSSTETNPPRYHLVVQTAFLGDVLLGIPFLKKIKEKFPEHHLAVVVRRGVGDFLLKTKVVDECFEVKFSLLHTDLKENSEIEY